jgi:hypothetical protein
MKTSRVLTLAVSTAILQLLTSCGGESESARAAQAATVKATADASAAAAAQAALTAPVKSGEFTLVITPDSDAAAANAIPVHVLSVSSDQVSQYKTMGADNYWKSPSGAAQKRVFGSSGTTSPATFSVPSRPGADTIVIIAKLPPSSGASGDARIMEIPLKRQPGSDPMKPVAPKINIRLSSLGLLPN